eukprot:4944146-Amphidinium_carterae.1
MSTVKVGELCTIQTQKEENKANKNMKFFILCKSRQNTGNLWVLSKKHVKAKMRAYEFKAKSKSKKPLPCNFENPTFAFVSESCCSGCNLESIGYRRSI